MIRFNYQVSRDEIIVNLSAELSKWGGFMFGDINHGSLSVLNGSLSIRADYSFSYEYVDVEITEKPDYVTIEIIEDALKPFFQKGELALFRSLLEEVSAPEEALALA